MSIQDWPAMERPREKLLHQGATALSDAELLAIFLRTGIRGCSAVDLSRQLIQQYGGLRGLLDADRQSFCACKGLGDAKFAQLQAVLEMSRRHLAEGLARGPSFSSSQAVEQYLQMQLRHRAEEVFACLFLDSQHQLISFDEMSHGTIDGAHVYPRVILKRALAHNAAAIILAHNHPSGVAEPSHADRQITDRLVKALALVAVSYTHLTLPTTPYV